MRRRGRDPCGVLQRLTGSTTPALNLRARPGWPKAGPLVNEKNRSGVSTIVHNQPSTQRLGRVDKRCHSVAGCPSITRTTC
jgi:hypothetical protein